MLPDFETTEKVSEELVSRLRYPETLALIVIGDNVIGTINELTSTALNSDVSVLVAVIMRSTTGLVASAVLWTVKFCDTFKRYTPGVEQVQLAPEASGVRSNVLDQLDGTANPIPRGVDPNDV
jgi:hypothetical protein